MDIRIYQGHSPSLENGDVHIVIDVIRAFTVAHYAFINGVKEILLVPTVEDAFRLKQLHPDYLLAGEVEGLPIKGFDLDNSPRSLLNKEINGKTLVQKTTNGVRATLSCLNAKEVFVTGFSNARQTAAYIKKKYLPACDSLLINIIASHPTGDDDVACAEYIRGILSDSDCISADDVAYRIKHSHVAEKFFDANRVEFQAEDVLISMKEVETDFVMKVNKDSKLPMIERVHL